MPRASGRSRLQIADLRLAGTGVRAIADRLNSPTTDLSGLVHHNDAGSQYTSIAFTDRLIAAGVDPSVGTIGDAYDNALAESIIGLFKTELVKPRGRWRTPEQLEIATLEYVDWSRYAGDPVGCRQGSAAWVTASIGDCPWRSHRACFAHLDLGGGELIRLGHPLLDCRGVRDLRLSANPLRDQRPDLPGRHRGRHRSRPGQVPMHRAHPAPPGRLVYAVPHNHDLLWYRHDGRGIGRTNWSHTTTGQKVVFADAG